MHLQNTKERARFDHDGVVEFSWHPIAVTFEITLPHGCGIYRRGDSNQILNQISRCKTKGQSFIAKKRVAYRHRIIDIQLYTLIGIFTFVIDAGKERQDNELPGWTPSKDKQAFLEGPAIVYPVQFSYRTQRNHELLMGRWPLLAHTYPLRDTGTHRNTRGRNH